MEENCKTKSAIFLFQDFFEFLKNGQKKCPFFKNRKTFPIFTFCVTIKKFKVRGLKK